MNTITTQEFKDKIFNYEEETEWKFKGDRNTIIKFSADSWCAPCKAYKPIYESIADETENVDFYSVDVDEEPELAQVFGVRSVPTTLFIPADGSQPQAGAGVIQKEKFSEITNEVFKS